MIYHHPLAYLLGVEGLALLRAWAGEQDYDEAFVQRRISEIRRLLADGRLAAVSGVSVERDATGAAYAEWAPTYDQPGNGCFDLDEPVIDEILESLPPPKAGAQTARTAVDAACGTGRLARRLLARGYGVIGVDSSPAMLEQARDHVSGSDFRTGDLDALPVPDDTADLVVTGLALTHVADLNPVYAEFARVLRPGGDLIVSDVDRDLVLLGSVVKVAGPNGRPGTASTHRHRTADHLQAALEAGFAVLRCEEEPRAATPETPLPEPTREIGGWADWPWTLLGWDPEAAGAAWRNPAVTIWHFRLQPVNG